MSCKKCKTNKCTCEVVTCINPLIYMIKGVFSLVGTDSNNLIPLEVLAKIRKENSRAVKINLPKQGAQLAVSDSKTNYETALAAFDSQGRYILDLPTALVEVLLGGSSISNNKNLCCPDCKNGVYFLGSAENFIDLYGTLDGTSTRICCLEHATTLSTWTNVQEALNEPLTCCNTDFADAFDLWINASSSSSALFYLDDILALGVLESSSFNGYSGLGILFNYLQLNHPELTPEDYLNILGLIVTLGLVIQCNDCEIVMSGLEQYLKWWEANFSKAAIPA